MTAITTHACERAHQRLGLSKAAVTRLAARALERGIRAGDVSGSARAYLNRHGMNHHTTGVVYGEFVFIFGVANRLVTVFEVPRELRATFAKALKRKAAER